MITAGNYGNAWWRQDKEFESFNGPVILTTNCLIPPKDSYKDRVYAPISWALRELSA